MSSATPLRALRGGGLAFDPGAEAAAFSATPAGQALGELGFSLHGGLEAIETQWRRFERVADGTPFQSFDWLATWQRHIGQRIGARPAIAVAAYADGATAFILPLAVEGRAVRRLCWLGQELNDYNAPLLARDFSQRVTAAGFRAAWDALRARMQREPMLRHDWIELEKMPQTIGDQLNPFFHLALKTNPSGAYLTELSGDWSAFYAAKRSSGTRRRDRAKLKHLAEFGEVSFVTCADADDARRTLETLMDQKGRFFASKGIADVFARPGWREFFLALVADPAARRLLHVSRMQVGSTCGAANLGIVFGDTYYHVLASYDDGTLAQYGPGALHLRELIAYALGRGLKRFDFTIGDEPYKLEWSDRRLSLGDYAAPVTWRGWPAWTRSSLRRPLKRFVKQTPWAWRVVSVVRAGLGSLWRLPHPPAKGQAAARAQPAPKALACVMGDMDLLRPIAMAGIRCAVVTRPGAPSLYSRYAQARLPWNDFSQDAAALIEELGRFGKARPEPPVLFYEEDAQLLFVSRFRAPLAQAFRFVVADAELVEDLVDKARFQALAERHALPVPLARRFHPAALAPEDLKLRFPVILKPLTRLARWNDTMGLRKALAADSPRALRALWPRLILLNVELLAQELVPGAETRIESYHCYVDRTGAIAGEFTGRKIRTYPAEFGHTTALEITEAGDVRAQGRAIAERIGLTGVAKFDFKRDDSGKLHLLEINPRFNLWHHAGALAGVNIPALVFADLTGSKRPQAGPARVGVRWCRPWADLPAARGAGVPVARWLAWAWRCEAKSGLSWDDPTPLARAALRRLVGRRFAPRTDGTRR